jgi:transposase-like protein
MTENISHLMYEPPRPNAPDNETPSHTSKVRDIARITMPQSAGENVEDSEPKQLTRRSHEEKRAILAEYDAAPHGEKIRVVEKYGLSSTGQIHMWRTQLGQRGLSTRIEPRTPAAKLHHLSAQQLKLRDRKTALTAQLDEVNSELRRVREQLKEAVTEMIGEDDE